MCHRRTKMAVRKPKGSLMAIICTRTKWGLFELPAQNGAAPAQVRCKESARRANPAHVNELSLSDRSTNQSVIFCFVHHYLPAYWVISTIIDDIFMLSYDERQNSCREQGPFYLGPDRPDRPDRRLGSSSFNVTSKAANLFVFFFYLDGDAKGW